MRYVFACLALCATMTTANDVPAAEYFSEYGMMSHHMTMLLDVGRMQAYRSAILNDAAHFKDKVVLDVGTGTGVLAIWAAEAGARRVYAVEQSSEVAECARTMAAHHGVADVVEVLEGAMEELNVPEKVDVIVSEWMGYFLVRESMAKSVIYARDTYLKPGGAMYPSHARLLLAPLDAGIFTERRVDEILEHMGSFDEIAPQLTEATGIDLTPLRETYYAEFLRDVFRNAWIGPVPAEDVHANSAVALLDVDMATATADELLEWSRTVEFGEKEIDGLVAWLIAAFAAGDDVVWLDTPRAETALKPVRLQLPARPLQRAPSLQPRARGALDFTLSSRRRWRRRRAAGEVAATYAITAEVRGFGDVDGDPATSTTRRSGGDPTTTRLPSLRRRPTKMSPVSL
ncbi:protein-arginine omega-N asymmetric methyltransferase [Aureococcus anophagefferens]|nr:protein-arginine omega-N asymmetric methyltransferase [Aureococcus anophagefferens]